MLLTTTKLIAEVDVFEGMLQVMLLDQRVMIPPQQLNQQTLHLAQRTFHLNIPYTFEVSYLPLCYWMCYGVWNCFTN